MRGLGRSGARARPGVWRRGSRGGASQVIEAGTGVGLAWRARCRGVAGPAGGKTARHAARGPRFRDRGGLPVTMTGRIQPVVATVLLIVEVVVLVRRGRLPLPRSVRVAFWVGVRSGVPW